MGPLQKKILIYGFLFIVICIVIILLIRSASHMVDGYYHSTSGLHCKKNNNCGSHKKHQCNGGSNSNQSGHNSCGGS